MPQVNSLVLQNLFHQAASYLTTLSDQLSNSAALTPGWETAQQILEALPLTTEEIAAARNHLRNARSYLEEGERGAAQYELRLLARSLSNKP